jgi:hypothetical protein
MSGSLSIEASQGNEATNLNKKRTMLFLQLRILATLFMPVLSAVQFVAVSQRMSRSLGCFPTKWCLQRDQAVPVWGWADAWPKMSAFRLAAQTKYTKADGVGKWRVMLDPLKAGEAGAMVVKGKNTITIKDVLVGEVWLASGQSNMHFNFLQRVTGWRQSCSRSRRIPGCDSSRWCEMTR